MWQLLSHLKLRALSAVGGLRKISFGKNAFAVVYRTDNGVLAIDPEDMGVGREIRKTGAYGQNELERLFRYVGQDSDVLVVGAHVGALVVPIAKKCKSVVAIEANPRTFGFLKTNLLLNDMSNVHAHNVAASDKEEVLEFVASRSNSGGTKRMPKVRAFEYFYDKPETISVPAFPLDAYLKDKAFSLVFMDIEGSEYFALKGMQRILERAETLFVEFLPHHLRNVSCVSPREFLDPVEPHFNQLVVPTKGLQVSKADFRPVLQSMFDNDEGDDGLIFTK